MPQLTRFQRFAISPHFDNGIGGERSFYPRGNPEAEPIGSYRSRCFPGFEEVMINGGMEWRLLEPIAIPVLFVVAESVG